MNELTKINNQEITLKEYNGQRVVTFKDIDQVHQRPEGTASRNFRKNQERFLNGVDYYKITPNEFRQAIGNMDSRQQNNITLITESGYLMLVKSFTDDLAWKVQRDLVNNYFRVATTANTFNTAMDKPDSYMIADPIERAKRWIEEEQKRQALKAENTLLSKQALEWADRELIRKLINKYSEAFKGNSDYRFGCAWNRFKEELNYNARINIEARVTAATKAKKKFKKLDLIKDAEIPTAIAIAIGLCKSANISVDKVVSEKCQRELPMEYEFSA